MNHSDLVQKYFMKDAVTVDEHRITALHTALVNGGVFVYVPKNVVVEHPVQYVVLHDDKMQAFITMLSSLLKKAPKSHMLKITYQMHLVKEIN